MVAQIVFLFLSHSIFRETSTQMDVKTVKNNFVKDKIGNNFPWSLLLSSREMTSKSSKLQGHETTHSYTTRGSTWVLNVLTSFLWLIRVETSRAQTMENCRFFFQLQDDNPPDDNDQGRTEDFVIEGA